MYNWEDVICEFCELEGCFFDKPVEGVDYSDCNYFQWRKRWKEELLANGLSIEQAEGIIDDREKRRY